jgi:uncharacterized protein YjbI with pentapeptide repeats
VAFIWYCSADARWRVAKLALSDPKDRAEIEDSYRKTTAQVVGAGAVALVFAYNLTKDNQTIEQTQSQAAATTFAEGVKLFKEGDPNVRASGIYLLERVASNRAEYREPIANALVSFIRSKTPTVRSAKAGRIDVDVRAAVHVLGRTAIIPENATTTLNLDGVNLAGADFSYLPGFAGRRLDGADLRVANFIGANLRGTQMSGAEMNDSAAFGPEFNEAVPRRPEWSYEKYWYAVQFDCADLTDALLDGSGLVGALFGRADLQNTHLERAVLSRADFTQAQNLDKAHFDNACADDVVQFPEGFDCQLRRCNEPLKATPSTCRYRSGAKRTNVTTAVEACRKR